MQNKYAVYEEALAEALTLGTIGGGKELDLNVAAAANTEIGRASCRERVSSPV